MSARLDAQFAFLLEADKLRGVERQNLVLDCSRCENSAEHSWHLALYALVLAPFAGPEVNVFRAIRMLLLHDLVEIDTGDHPITDDVDWEAVAISEQTAAKRLFALLPADQEAEFLALWQEFEKAESPDARFAKQVDHCQPIFQTLYGAKPLDWHVEVVRQNLNGGRAATLEQDFPQAFHHALSLLGKDSGFDCGPLTARLGFLNEADQLKLVIRASKLGDGSRHENSAEHSWHIMLYAWVLAEHSVAEIDVDRVLQMLLLHDLVEVDAGDTPIHGVTGPEVLQAKAEAETAAAIRLFGLLPQEQGKPMLAIWEEFEAAESPDAVFSKSIDRVQPVLLNLLNGGGSWVDYNVSLPQLDTRVGDKVNRGAPDVWTYVRARIEPWFRETGRL
ncbi:HD domain-containing protein [Leisingera sp. S232]|uniref:HD domain-containing protein n=1 Tax=Leisingera sp. S232 TaxID=3415132 RepID=UPI003C7DE52E